MADILGVSRNTITNLAGNKSVPNLALAYDIVEVLNKRGCGNNTLNGCPSSLIG
ncbi:helix-turn-helix domain-containing protein [Brevibacillus massiliensis]|uniref:helix-turn-helix domain-containing protein n=1 Tax=Brevibacillus massiliensis TaxID=1118054 RepID=UPI0036F2D735